MHEYSAGAVIYFQEAQRREYLLIKHKNGGHWDFPKGHQETGESLLDTARREILEETGLIVEINPDFKEEVLYSPKVGVMKTVIFFLATLKHRFELFCQQEEVLEAKWLSYQEAIKLCSYQSAKEILEKAESFLNKNRMQWYDISPLLSSDTPVYPGDQPLKIESVLSSLQGHTLTLSTLMLTAHLGSHADAYSHTILGAESIDEMSLLPYCGPCQLIELELSNEKITQKELEGYDIVSSRLIIKTKKNSIGKSFDEHYRSFSLEAVRYLYQKNIILIGIDTPSVDGFKEELMVHQAFVNYKISVLEGLELGSVQPDIYELIALPLKFKGIEASPVRAILKK